VYSPVSRLCRFNRLFWVLPDCGDFLTIGSEPVADSNCSSNCVGNPSETCGGSDFLDIFWNGQPPGPRPTIVSHVPEAPLWGFVACYSDSITARTLSAQVSVKGGAYNNTVGNCIDSCIAEGYSIAGLEFAQQCWCGNTIGNGAESIDLNDCTLACSGDNTECCGGADALLLYQGSN